MLTHALIGLIVALTVEATMVDINFLRHRLDFGEPKFRTREKFPFTSAFLSVSGLDLGEYVDTVTAYLAEGPAFVGERDARTDNHKVTTYARGMVSWAQKMVGHKCHEGGPIPLPGGRN